MDRRQFFGRASGTAAAVAIGSPVIVQAQSEKWMQGYLQLDPTCFVVVEGGKSRIRFTVDSVLSATVKIQNIDLLNRNPKIRRPKRQRWTGEDVLIDLYFRREYFDTHVNQSLFNKWEGSIPIKYRWVGGNLHIVARGNK